jgi:hypothetical protein
MVGREAVGALRVAQSADRSVSLTVQERAGRSENDKQRETAERLPPAPEPGEDVWLKRGGQLRSRFESAFGTPSHLGDHYALLAVRRMFSDMRLGEHGGLDAPSERGREGLRGRLRLEGRSASETEGEGDGRWSDKRSASRVQRRASYKEEEVSSSWLHAPKLGIRRG